jgi:hypothetical protein
MVNELEFYKRKTKLDIEPIWQIYASVVEFHQLPLLRQINLSYGSRIEGKIQAFHASFYPDDFYDGTPGTVPKVIPDSLKNNLSEYIGEDINVSEEDIRQLLEDFCMFYIDGKKIFHDPIVEVW